MVSRDVQNMVEVLKEYFVSKPVVRAWIFGSCSRGEERPDSDVDLLIQYDKDSHIGLLAIGGMYMDLRRLLQRDVDLVEDGTLFDYAKESAERDKILIYERAA